MGKPDVLTYCLASRELYVEDVDQHMAVLTEIFTSTSEFTIDDVKVGGPDLPLTNDQQQLIKLIC